MQGQWFTLNMFDTQASWAREELSGDRKYPINYQGEYVKELISQTDYPSFDVDGACKAFYQWKKHKSLAIHHEISRQHVKGGYHWFNGTKFTTLHGQKHWIKFRRLFKKIAVKKPYRNGN